MGEEFGETDRRTGMKIFWYILIPIIIGILVVFTGLFLEYKTNIFNHFASQTFSLILNKTLVPTAISIETIDTITVSEASLGALFNGDLTIAVESASKFWNRATVSISSPGYDTFLIDAKKVGFKTIYTSNRKYEILISAIDTPSETANNSLVTFIVVASPYLVANGQTAKPQPTSTPNSTPTSTPIIFDLTETIIVSQANTANTSDGDLIIAVEYASKMFNQITAQISSPGYDQLEINREKIGFKTMYRANLTYEIQIMAIEDIEPYSVTFVVRRYKQ